MNEDIVKDAKIIGGSEADRKALLQLLDDYIVANSHVEWEELKHIWSTHPDATFFNLNGHTYIGPDHWRRLWAYYKLNVRGSYWTPYDIGGEITDQMAVIWCHRHSNRKWIGKDHRPPREIHYEDEKFMSRQTLVFHREDGVWRVLHAHFSVGDTGARPGGV